MTKKEKAAYLKTAGEILGRKREGEIKLAGNRVSEAYLCGLEDGWMLVQLEWRPAGDGIVIETAQELADAMERFRETGSIYGKESRESKKRKERKG